MGLRGLEHAMTDNQHSYLRRSRLGLLCGCPGSAAAGLLLLGALVMATGAQTLAQGPLAEASIAADVATVKRIGLEASGYEAATAAARRLSTQPSSAAGQVLEAMKEASPLAKNWLRMIAADVADNPPFPREVLLEFFADRSQDSDARHAAYQALLSSDPALKAVLLEDAVDDPSLPVRHAAIALTLEQAAKQNEAGNKDAATDLFRMVVANGRNPDQLQAAAKSLGELGDKIDLADELGLIRRWWVIGPFDNTASAEFETVYLPEQVYLHEGRLPADWLKADATVVKDGGKGQAAMSHLVVSDHSFGVVSINPALQNAKDAIAYGYVEFDVAEGVQAVARIGCITASKVWVNGQFVMGNEVYHSGTRIDQYVGDCQLLPGRNSVLIKICQNAQTESWAQDWQFQFRLTDRFETPIKPQSIVQPRP